MSTAKIVKYVTVAFLAVSVVTIPLLEWRYEKWVESRALKLDADMTTNEVIQEIGPPSSRGTWWSSSYGDGKSWNYRYFGPSSFLSQLSFSVNFRNGTLFSIEAIPYWSRSRHMILYQIENDDKIHDDRCDWGRIR